MDESKVLVVGATGTVGQEVVRALVERATPTVALVRGERAAASLPAQVEPRFGDLNDESAVARALDGVRAAFYLSPHIEEEEHCARQFTRLCNERGLRVVFVGSHLDGRSRFSRWLMRSLAGTLMPHYRAKFRLSERVRREATDGVLLVPSHFYQNDELDVVRGALLHHQAFIQPIGSKGHNRVDVRDIGQAAARALLDPSIGSGAYPIVGPESLTGPQCAQIWSAALATPIEYREMPELWEEGLRSELTDKKFADTMATCRQLKKFRVPTVAEHVRTTTELLGRAPTDYESYVGRTVASWSTGMEAESRGGDPRSARRT